jgi:hypothetical protein
MSNECNTAIVCAGTSFSSFICKQEDQPLPPTCGWRLSGRSAAGLSTVESLGDRDTGDHSRWIRTERWTLFVNSDIPYQVQKNINVDGLSCSNSNTVSRRTSRVRALFNWRINSINIGVSTTRCMALGSALRGKGYRTGGGSGCGSCCRICCRNLDANEGVEDERTWWWSYERRRTRLRKF